MNRKQWMLLASVLVLVVVAVAADGRRVEKEAAQDTAAEVVFGRFDCTASAIGTVSVTFDVSGGTAGVIASDRGFQLTQLFNTTFTSNEQAAQTCEDTIESLATKATGVGCTAGPVRGVSNRRSVGLVCGGDRTQTVNAVGALGRAVLELEF